MLELRGLNSLGFGNDKWGVCSACLTDTIRMRTCRQLGNRVPSPLGYYCRYVNTEVLEFIELHLSDLKVFYLTNNIYFYKRIALLKRMNSKFDGKPIQLTLWNEFRNRNNLQPCWLIVTVINTRKLSVCFVSSGLKIIEKLGLWTSSFVSWVFKNLMGIYRLSSLLGKARW